MMRTQSQKMISASSFSMMYQKSFLASCSGRPYPCVPRWVGVPTSPTSLSFRLSKSHGFCYLLGCCWAELIYRKMETSPRDVYILVGMERV